MWPFASAPPPPTFSDWQVLLLSLLFVLLGGVILSDDITTRSRYIERRFRCIESRLADLCTELAANNESVVADE